MKVRQTIRNLHWNPRLFLICLTSVSVSFPIAIISLSKVAIFVFCLGFLTKNGIRWFKSPRDREFNDQVSRWTRLWSIRSVLVIFFTFAISLIWTNVDLALAALNIVKHGKLLAIVVLAVLVRTSRDARFAIISFAVAQIFVLASSWLLAAGVPLPWAVKDAGKYVVFSSYLDQSIMFGATSAVLWHLRNESLWAKSAAGLAVVAALLNVLLLLEGRTGYIVSLAMISLGVMWALPNKLRLVTLIVTPLICLSLLYVSSNQVRVRVSGVIGGAQHYVNTSETTGSEGWRLNAWRRSVQAIQERPWIGHGVGSWTTTVKRIEGEKAQQIFGPGKASNPHQEFLLWGVELGLVGPFLLLMLFASICRDARNFHPPYAKAIWSVVVALSISCMFNSTLYDGLIGDFFCVLLGLLLALGNSCKTGLRESIA